MAVEVSFGPDFVRMDFHGTVTPEALGAAMQEIEAMERSGKAPHRLADLTHLSLKLTSLDVVRGLAVKRRTIALPNDVKTAIVAPSPAAVGFARMFQTLNDNPRIAIKIFDAEADAVRWLLEK